ncbi:hypothetical protein RSAG8_06745, partial [Rhizoctonia solani AG-8 WAC10335]
MNIHVLGGRRARGAGVLGSLRYGEKESTRVNHEPLGHVRDPDKRHSIGFTLESNAGDLVVNSGTHTLRCKSTIDIIDVLSSCVHFQPHWSQVSPRRCGTWALLPRHTSVKNVGLNLTKP